MNELFVTKHHYFNIATKWYIWSMFLWYHLYLGHNMKVSEYLSTKSDTKSVLARIHLQCCQAQNLLKSARNTAGWWLGKAYHPISMVLANMRCPYRHGIDCVWFLHLKPKKRSDLISNSQTLSFAMRNTIYTSICQVFETKKRPKWRSAYRRVQKCIEVNEHRIADFRSSLEGRLIYDIYL